MLNVVESFAQLTALRDRELIDIALLRALNELLKLESLSIFGLVGTEDDPRWVERVRMESDGHTSTRDSMWLDISLFPSKSSRPDLVRCLESAQIESFRPEGSIGFYRTLFPVVVADQGSLVRSIAQISSPKPLDDVAVNTVTATFTLYRNLLALLDYSELDTLTGLYNRKSFDDSFFRAMRVTQHLSPVHGDASDPSQLWEEQDRRSAASKERYWLAVIDIDHFKRVNDTFGHLIGDEVLLLVAQLLRHSFRSYDRLYRFGGEEFVIMFRCQTSDSARAVLERFRARMEAYDFPQAGRVTVSVGFTGLSPNDSPSTTFERADQAVYFGKRNGRNQVCFHEDLVEQQVIAVDTKIGDIELF